MATINQVEKTSYAPVKISYTDKDYANILDDLINSISGITDKWNTTDANDPGLVLVKLMAILGDMLFYNQDMQSLEVYPNSVTQRKNAASIYKLIGYKMRWYKSATLQANVVNTYSNFATLPRFCTFTTANNEVTYCTFDQYELKSNTNNNGFEELVTLVQGTPITPVRASNNPYPDVGKAWHTVYGYNFTTDDIVNNRIYLNYTEVDQAHIIVVDDTDYEWEFKDNIYLTKDVGRFFEFGVDVNDQPYIELVDYWHNFNVHKFKIFYIRSSGESGQIYANTLKNVTGSVWSRTGSGDGQRVYNVSSFLKFTHYDSTPGWDPETPEEKKKNASVYQNTIDTLITLADFERASLRHELTANVRATDLTNDPGIKKTCLIGDINQDGTIDELDYNLLNDYCIDPVEHALSSYQKKLADLSQDGDPVGRRDLQLFYNYLHPTMVQVGDINMDGIIDTNDKTILRTYLDDPSSSSLTNFQKRLCDFNQDGVINEDDYTALNNYINHSTHTPDEEPPYISDDSDEAIGKCGKQSVSTVELLDGFVVKLYILPTEKYQDYEEEDIKDMLMDELGEYKILPLTIEVDTHSINKYYWTVKGKFITKTPLSRDELQTIIININNALRYKYAVDKVNFNTLINYKEVIETMLSVDNRILMIDLDPIEYVDVEGQNISKEQVTGKYIQTEPMLNNTRPEQNLHYNIILENTTVLPGSVMIRVNGGQYTLRDNNNGEIYNIDNILQYKGSINYVTGEIDLLFNSPVSSDLVIEYVHNTTNIALYRNLSTQTFYYDSSSLEQDGVQDLV